MLDINSITNYQMYNDINSADTSFPSNDAQRTKSTKETIKKEVSENIRKHEIEREKIDDAIKTANKLTQLSHIRLQFKLHKATGYIVVKVIDMDHDKVIKEIPPEKLLDILSGIGKKMAGLFVDSKV